MVLHLTVLGSARAWSVLAQKKEGTNSWSHIKLVAAHISDGTTWLEQNGSLQGSRTMGWPRLSQHPHSPPLLSYLLVLRLGLAEACLVWSLLLRRSSRVRHTWREQWLPPTRHSPWHPQSSAPVPSGSHG